MTQTVSPAVALVLAATPVDLPQPTPTDVADPHAAALVHSADARWTYHRRWDELGEPLRVTHVASGLTRDYYGRVTLTTVVHGHVPSGRLEADFRTLALSRLNDITSTPKDRAQALRAVDALAMVEAWCGCGGLLTRDLSTWRHLNVCGYCLDDPTACTATDVGRHRMCDRPSPEQCDHDQCRRGNHYLATLACDRGETCCGQGHDCDTAVC